VNDDFVLNVDFAPTFIEYGGGEAPGDVQGRSFQPLLRGETPADWRTSFYYQIYHANSSIDRRLPHYGIRTRQYRLAQWYREIDDWELYDLRDDPAEMRNVYRDPAYAEVVATLTDELRLMRTELGIDATMEQEIADRTMTGYWSNEVNEYRDRKMNEWRAAAEE
jgi:arylsulfatase A-like enzyme